MTKTGNIINFELADGITTLGRTNKNVSAGFTYKWARHLAHKNKVLYVNFKDDQTDFVTLENEMFNAHEYIDPEVNYGLLTPNLFLTLLNTINSEKIQILFIDYRSGQFHENTGNFCPDLAAYVNVLSFISRHFQVKVVCALDISVCFRLEPPVIIPTLKTFGFPRALINRSQQVYYLYQPDSNVRNEILENKQSLDFELFDLKNKDKEEGIIHLGKEVQDMIKILQKGAPFNYY